MASRIKDSVSTCLGNAPRLDPEHKPYSSMGLPNYDGNRRARLVLHSMRQWRSMLHAVYRDRGIYRCTSAAPR